MDYSKNIKSSCLEADADYFRSAKMTIHKAILKKKKYNFDKTSKKNANDFIETWVKDITNEIS